MGCGGLSALSSYAISRIGICKLCIIICCVVAAGIVGKHFTDPNGDVYVEVKLFEFVLFATIWS